MSKKQIPTLDSTLISETRIVLPGHAVTYHGDRPIAPRITPGSLDVICDLEALEHARKLIRTALDQQDPPDALTRRAASELDRLIGQARRSAS